MKQGLTNGDTGICTSITSITLNRCQVCHFENGKIFRCSRCREAWYCSVACQHFDWKSGHRRLCKNKYPKTVNESERPDDRLSKRHAKKQHVQAKEAYDELSKMVCSSTLSILHQDFNLANDVVENLKREAVDRNATTKKASLPILSKKDETKHSKNTRQIIQEPYFDRTSAYNQIDFWQIYCEDMQHLKCYQLLLRPQKHVGKITLENVEVSLFPSASSSTKTCTTLLSVVLKFPKNGNPDTYYSVKIEMQRNILPESCSVCIVDENEAISIRLSYSPIDPIEPSTATMSILNPSQSTYLACKECKNKILRGVAPSNKIINVTNNEASTMTKIKRVLPLASSRWDDMEDYLICYAGQPVVDFGLRGTSGQRYLLFEDETIMVAHRHDVGESACVLAIPGYGQEDEFLQTRNDKNNDTSMNGTKTTSPLLESVRDSNVDPSALFRGNRSWREAVDGATLTCSQCASVLGFAPIDLSDTYRFLKHRLILLPHLRTSTNPDAIEKEPPRLTSFQTVSNFICYEMIRYAETKAIFSFVVTKEATKRHTKRDCLLLRLLSWDSLTCCISSPSNHNTPSRMMQWNKTAKLLYSKSHEYYDPKNHVMNENMDVWMWAQSDWCCKQPMDSESKSSIVVEEKVNSKSESMVRICLSDSEWNEISRDLGKSSQHFSKEVVEAVVYATTGEVSVADDDLMLASIPLQYIA